MAAKVGLTGGIGSGKSAVAEAFAALGVTVIDADAIARQLSAPGGAAFDSIVAQFGDEIVDAQGGIDRARLGRMVFASDKKRRALEAILHPPIRAWMHAQAAREAGAYCILDIPLLIESKQHRDMQRVLVITCARAERIRRVKTRAGNSLTVADIERVMEAQVDDDARLKAADDVIDNNGDLEELQRQVQRLHENYTALFS